MSDLIKREDVIRAFAYSAPELMPDKEWFSAMIGKIPSAKPETGRWELKGKPEDLNVVCSECGEEAPFIKKTLETGKGKRSMGVLFESPYCPSCGSRMEDEDE